MVNDNEPAQRLLDVGEVPLASFYVNPDLEVAVQEAQNNNEIVLENDGSVRVNSETIWDGVVEEIPDTALGTVDNSTLANDSVTVSAGDGLKSGGSVSLGGSVTLDTDPADFAGTFLSDDGNDDLQVEIGRGLENDGSGNIQFDENTSYFFTSDQTFESGLRVATGQSIEDDSGVDRIQFNSNFTSLRYEDGFQGFTADNNRAIRVNPRAGTPFRVYDHKGDFVAYEYQPASGSPGTLELRNAKIDANNNPINGASQIGTDKLSVFDSIQVANGTDGGAIINTFSGGNGEGRLDLISAHGPETTIATHHRLIGQDDAGNTSTLLKTLSGGRVTIPNGNLRLATGQSIEDGDGTKRFGLARGQTGIYYEDGTEALEVAKDLNLSLRAYSGTPVTIFDEDGVFTAFTYKTSSSAPGTLELTNANLDVLFNKIKNSSGPVNIGTGDRFKLNANRVANSNDTNGSQLTFTDGGSASFSLNNLNSNGTFYLYDHRQSQIALWYNSGTVGTLELRNATLDANSNDVTNVNSLDAEQIGDSYLFASSFSGSDPDTRLDNALSAASDASAIYIEPAVYGKNRTISKPVALIAPARVGGGVGAEFQGDLTFSVNEVSTVNVRFNQNTVQINGANCSIDGAICTNATINVDASDVILTRLRSADVTFQTNSFRCVVDSSTSVSVTDNGTDNVVGDIA